MPDKLTKVPASIEVAETEHTGYIRLSGKATFKLAPDFKDFVVYEMKKGKRGILIDFSDCETIDSTFVGTITSLSLTYNNKNNNQIKLFNVNDHILSILKNLGLINVLDISNSVNNEETDFKSLKLVKREKVEIANLMLDAHETLASISEENAVVFKNVVEMLRRETK